MSRSPAAPQPLAPLTQQAAWYPDDLVSELQSTLAALADLEVQYEVVRERLEAWAGPEGIKKFAAQLEEHYHRKREGYVQRLTDLHCWIIKIMTREDIGSSP